MTRITAIANQKGGVAKTTTAQMVASGLSKAGYHVLAIDTDGQANLTYAMGANGTDKGIYEAMKGTAADSLIIHASQGDILPSTEAIIGIDQELTQTGREYLLKESLKPVLASYDHIIIDCQPSLGIMTVNALTAADDIIIPIPATAFGVQGLAQLYDLYKRVKKYCNPKLKVAGLLFTHYNDRTIMTRTMTDEISKIADELEASIYKTKIRTSIVVDESQLQQQSLFDTAPGANPAIDYKAFITEYLKQEKTR